MINGLISVESKGVREISGR